MSISADTEVLGKICGEKFFHKDQCCSYIIMSVYSNFVICEILRPPMKYGGREEQNSFKRKKC